MVVGARGREAAERDGCRWEVVGACVAGGGGGGKKSTFRDTVSVVARFRPLTRTEAGEGGARSADVTSSGDGVMVRGGDGRLHAFGFEHVFGETASQEEVFARVGVPLAHAVLAGMNASLLAYGQTGSGKTHTLLGAPVERGVLAGRSGAHGGGGGGGGGTGYDITGPSRGLLPRVLAEIFSARDREPGATLQATATFVEVYQEEVFDLLDADLDRPALRCRQTDENTFTVPARQVECGGLADAFSVLRRGLATRARASTTYNADSSRSHAIFSLHVQLTRGREVRRAVLQVADLAGSEDARRAGDASAGAGHAQLRAEEGRFINRGLHALGNVCAALALSHRRLRRGAEPAHVPYRDSELTKLLASTIGGDCRTALVVCCSPAAQHAHESISTLRFGERAACIVARPKAHVAVDHAQMRRALLQVQESLREDRLMAKLLARAVFRLAAVAEEAMARQRLGAAHAALLVQRFPVIAALGSGAADFGHFLPRHVLWNIFGFAGSQTTAAAAAVSRGLRRVVADDNTWEHVFNAEVRARGSRTGHWTQWTPLEPTAATAAPAPPPAPVPAPAPVQPRRPAAAPYFPHPSRRPLFAVDQATGCEVDAPGGVWGPAGPAIWKPRPGESFRAAVARWREHWTAETAKGARLLTDGKGLRLLKSVAPASARRPPAARDDEDDEEEEEDEEDEEEEEEGDD